MAHQGHCWESLIIHPLFTAHWYGDLVKLDRTALWKMLLSPRWLKPYVSSGLRLTCSPLIPSVSNRKALSINLFTPGSKPVWSVIEPFHR